MIDRSTLPWLALVICAGFGLYQIKDEVRNQERELARLNAEIQKRQEAIGVLRAEWAHLDDPARIEALSREHLGLKPIAPDQRIDIEEIPMRDASPEGQAPGRALPGQSSPLLRGAGQNHAALPRASRTDRR